MLLVASCWVPCDGLASLPGGGGGGGSDTPNQNMLKKLEPCVTLMDHLASLL